LSWVADLYNKPFSSCGGGIDASSVIGNPPESRTWKPGDPMFEPTLSDGVRVEAFVTVDAGEKRPTTVGARTWLMKHVHIGHDAIIGADCELAPGVVVCGYAVIGDRVKIGVNACVLPFVEVGADVRIGAGAVVTKNYFNGVLVGNPARPLIKDLA
jgi:UDP-3-O-[3-hydroxymyristoyl] glucosamine N-acyltransferase